MKNIKTYNLYYLLILFLYACDTPKTFNEVQSVVVDESKFAITGYPLEFRAIDDSICVVIMGAANDNVLIYNYKNGKLIKHLDFKKFNHDSLVAKYLSINNPSTKFFPLYDSTSNLLPELPPVKHFHCTVNLQNKHLFLDYQPGIKYVNIQDPENLIFGNAAFILETDIKKNIYRTICVRPIIEKTPLTNNTIQNNCNNGFFILQDKLYMNSEDVKDEKNRCVAKYSILNDSIMFEKKLPIFYPSKNDIYQNMEYVNSFFELNKTIYISNQKNIFTEQGENVCSENILENQEHDQIQKFYFLNQSAKKVLYHVAHIDTADNFKNTIEYIALYNTLNAKIEYFMQIMNVDNIGKVDFYNDQAIVFIKSGNAYYFKIYTP